jgi:trigger factor
MAQTPSEQTAESPARRKAAKKSAQGEEKPPQEVRVEVEAEGPVVRCLRVEVSERRVRKLFDRAYRELGRQAQLPGFRPGKVPRSVLEKRFGATVAEDVRQSLVADTLVEALEQVELVPLVEPDLEWDLPSPGAPFHYTARIEVRPEIELPELEGLPAKRPPVELGEEDVEAEIESLRQRAAPLVEEPEETQAEMGHVLSIDYTGRIDGREFEGGKGEDVVVELGSERLLPGFEEQLVGARAGEEREVRVTFPDDYGKEDLRGQEAVFSVRVTSIRRRRVPALDDEFAKDVGDFETLEELRGRIRTDLLEQRERAARQALERSVLDALLERTSVELPPRVVERELRGRMASFERQFEGQVPREMLQAQLARIQEEGREAAERRVREAFVLSEIARVREIEVGDEDVAARLDEMARARGADPRRLRQAAREQGWEDSIRSELIEQRVLDTLLADAKIEEVSET